MPTAKKQNTQHGGARTGAGRKATDASGPVERKSVSLDQQSVETLRRLGEGDLSVGIRRAAHILRNGGSLGD